MGKVEKNDDYFTPYPKYIEVPDGYWITTKNLDVDVEYLEKEN
tara:strand:+ start:2206 stop:2334 length:129 start_codon:yes stop_codon:yes gene_type:complete